MTQTYVTGGAETRTVAPNQQTELWRRHVTDNMGGLDYAFATQDAFAGRTRVQRSGDFQVVDFWSDPMSYIRRRNAADHDGDDSLRLLLPLTGELSLATPSADFRFDPQSVAAVPMTAESSVSYQQPTRALVLSVPSRRWEASPLRAPIVWETDQGAGAVFSAMLREVVAQRAHLDAASFAQACESAVMLICGCHGEVDVLSQARTLARQHADDAEFDPTALAALLGWSLRSVQLALRRAGTSPAELIRNERLERAASRLRHPAWRDHTISHVAHASGFGSLSAFNSSFRSRFGYPPTDLRASAPRRDEPSSVCLANGERVIHPRPR